MAGASAMNPAARRALGFALGTLLGLVYGAVSQGINRVVLPGVPLYQPPFGPFGNSMVIALVGAGLGLVTAWPAGGIQGTFLGSGVAAVIIVGVTFVGVNITEQARAGVAVAAVFLLLPLVGMIVPALGFFRWILNRQIESAHEAIPSRRRAWGPAAATLLTIGAAALSLYRGDARQELAALNTVLSAGGRAANSTDLPAALRTPEVGDFQTHAQSAYTLEWTQQNLNRFRIPRPGHNFDSHAVVVARFADGWRLACLFVAADEPPVCQSY